MRSIALGVLTAMLFTPASADAWGFEAHKFIVSRAIDIGLWVIHINLTRDVNLRTAQWDGLPTTPLLAPPPRLKSALAR